VNYDEKNRDNEMIVVVDASYSNAERQAEKDQYIRTLLIARETSQRSAW